MNEKKKAMLKFMRYPMVLQVMGVLMLIGGAVDTTLSIKHQRDSFDILLAVLVLICGAYLTVRHTRQFLSLRKDLAAYEAKGELENVVNDFATGKAYLGNQMTVGETYVFSVGGRRVLPASELTHVTVKKSTSFFTGFPQMMVGMTKDGTVTLAGLSKSVLSTDIMSGAKALRRRNPNIEFHLGL